MRSSGILWTIAVVLALVFSAWQRVSGPTYPIYGHATLAGTAFAYKLERTHAGAGDHDVAVTPGGGGVAGSLRWREHADGAPWTIVPLRPGSRGALVGTLPHRGPGQKLDYLVELVEGNASVTLPARGPATIRFRNDVPWWILIPHIVCMMGALLLSTRGALEAMAGGPKLKEYTLRTLSALFLGGFPLGCAVSAFAFGQPWGGFPLGHDATDNKTLVAFIAWVIAAVVVMRSRSPRAVVIAAAVVMTLVYMIPHSFALPN